MKALSCVVLSEGDKKKRMENRLDYLISCAQKEHDKVDLPNLITSLALAIVEANAILEMES